MHFAHSRNLTSTLLIGGILLMALVLVQSKDPSSQDAPHIRHKRGIFWDFFQKMVITKNLIVDQYTDTRNTLNDIYNTVNEQFSDPGPAKPTNRPRVTTEKISISGEENGSNSEEPTTTTEAFQISRYELGRILGRNFRGLQKLAMSEFSTALNATKYNLAEYKSEADKQFANSLAVEKKNKLKSLKG
uniref:Uncharacterized protein, isoform B n=1 Tax=Drosophila melanogaster TaxID=7227 RepID=A8JUN7_DROME|nr:uncharacterized protein Dmel_CG15249, isoform B [Drosophila melanogaster]NP_001096929.2 uncharacterized protein Dmel_CG15249, isoform D [Drosophila melanogaster]ABW09375.1 uncharacterized protein Dmel_CG15249, isoform B [Drosophila melanogaster]ABW09376.2 uncharacterized protein Dmel_CG15249, isoform D [Drosophila melanogaster]|eukprot:NP_001096928.1 uncharacterized protein Dmel_CG15249, isoform B [Drosophila melanogaster]